MKREDEAQRAQEEQWGSSIDPEKFIESWGEFAERAKKDGKKSLHMLMTQNEIEHKGEGKFLLKVGTETLRETFNSEKTRIVDYLIATLGSSRFEIGLEVEAIPDEEKRKYITSPIEKYEHMLKQNPDLKDFMNELDLDFDY